MRLRDCAALSCGCGSLASSTTNSKIQIELKAQVQELEDLLTQIHLKKLREEVDTLKLIFNYLIIPSNDTQNANTVTITGDLNIRSGSITVSS